jgi:hypothetical protein
MVTLTALLSNAMRVEGRIFLDVMLRESGKHHSELPVFNIDARFG